MQEKRLKRGKSAVSLCAEPRLRASGKLTRKQQRFVREYLTDFNATQAAIRAGYSPKGASVQGASLLAVVKVLAKVERLSKCRDAQLALTSERILAKLAEIAFAEDEKTRDNLRALDILCKTRGLYLRTHEVPQEGIVINLNMGEPPCPDEEAQDN